jgi:hypothetical protein
MPHGQSLFRQPRFNGFAQPDSQIFGTKLLGGSPHRDRVKIIRRLPLDINGNPLWTLCHNVSIMIAIRFARLSPQAKNRFVIVSFPQTHEIIQRAMKALRQTGKPSSSPMCDCRRCRGQRFDLHQTQPEYGRRLPAMGERPLVLC